MLQKIELWWLEITHYMGSEEKVMENVDDILIACEGQSSIIRWLGKLLGNFMGLLLHS